MEIFFRTVLFLVGVVNVLPALIAFMPSKISSSYGVGIPDSNYELLLRHRGVFFGIIGGFMIYSAFCKSYYKIATFFGTISMISFVFLYYIICCSINSKLHTIMMIDIFATVILLGSYIAYLLAPDTVKKK